MGNAGTYSLREFFSHSTFALADELPRSIASQLHVLPKADARPWYSIENKANDGEKKTAEILIYDEIDPFFGVSAGDFANDLNALDADEITVGINSPGGIVFDGIAIMNALKRHPANIITRIDGLAASAASFIAMAGDEIVTSKYAEMMIHEARGVVVGTAADFAAMKDLLIRHNQSIASVYADRAGGPVKDWLKRMKDETWFTADEMVAAGLADRILETDEESSGADEAETMKNRFDLTVFAYAGRKLAPAPTIRTKNRTEGRKPRMATVKEQIAEKLGLDPDVEDATLIEKLDEKLAEPATEPGTPPEVADPTSEQIAAHAKKLGFAMVDEDTLDTLKTQAKDGSAALAKMLGGEDETLIDQAIRKGKLPPAARAKWLKNLAADRETFRAALDQLEEGVIPVTEIGHGVTPPEMSAVPDDLSWFDVAPTEPANASNEGNE